MTAAPEPLAELRALHEALAGLGAGHALIGGWAAVAWGSVRATKDFDLLFDWPRSRRLELDDLMRDAGYEPEWRAGGEDDPLPELLRLRPTDPARLPADLIPAFLPYHREALLRAKSVDLGGWSMPAVGPEDLIAMKLAAGGGLDYRDAKAVLAVQAEKLDEDLLLGACRALKVLDRLEVLRA